MGEQELTEAQENISDLQNQNQNIATSKRHLESEMDTMKQDLDDANTEARMVEDKARMAMMDAAKLADELRIEQDQTSRLDNERRIMESQVKELQARLDEAEAYAMKTGKKAAQKLENKIRELENELDGEQRRLGDSSKNLRKSERRIKELEFQAAEEIAAMNLAKFRKTQVDLEEGEERADLSEHALAKLRATAGRSRGTTPLPGIPNAL